MKNTENSTCHLISARSMYCGVVMVILGVKGNVYKDMMQRLALSRPSVQDSNCCTGFPAF